MAWRDTHPGFDVPDWLDQHPDVDDVTEWQASTGTLDEDVVEFRSGDDGPIVWVQHPDAARRRGSRFWVFVFWQDREENEGELDVVRTADGDVARDALEWALAEVRRRGAQATAELYWGPSPVFDERGRSNRATVPDLSATVAWGIPRRRPNRPRRGIL